jgi:hypothetical protein
MPHGIGGVYLQTKSSVHVANPASLEKRNWLQLFIIFCLLSVAVFAVPSFQISKEAQKNYLSDAKIASNGPATSVSFQNFMPIDKISGEKALDSKSLGILSAKILADNEKALKIKQKDLRLQSVIDDRSADKNSGYSYVFFRQYYQNIPVLGSEVKILYVDNKIASINSKYYSNLKIDVKPKIKEEKAASIAKNSVKFDEKIDKVVSKTLVILPNSEDDKDARLAWSITLTSDSTEDNQEILVDAQNGKVLNQHSLVEHATIDGIVTGVIWNDWKAPYYDLPSPAIVPFKDLKVSIYNQDFNYTDYIAGSITDTNGFYSITYTNSTPVTLISKFVPYMNGSLGGAGQRHLESPYAWVRYHVTYNTPDSLWTSRLINHTYNLSDSVQQTHDWLWNESEPTDWRVNNSEANVFYHVNNIRNYFAAGAAPFNIERLDSLKTIANLRSMVTNGSGTYRCGVSSNPSSNASYAYMNLGGNGFNLYSGSQGECPNTALSSDAIYHEFGHVVIAKALYNQTDLWGWINQDDWTEGAAMEEAFGDYYAATLSNDPFMDFWTVYTNTGKERNISNTKRYSEFNRNPAPYNPSLYFNSLILSGALWDLRQNLTATYPGQNEVWANGTHRADAMILYAFKDRPTNFSEFMASIIQIASGSQFGGDDNISNSPDRWAICDAFNFKHGISPNGTAYEDYCIRPGDVYTTNSTGDETFEFIPYENITVNGSGFAPYTTVTVHAYIHPSNRNEGDGFMGGVPPIISSVVQVDAQGNFGTPIMNDSSLGSYDIFVDANNNGIYDSALDSLILITVSFPFSCDANEPALSVSVEEGTWHYLSIFNIAPNEFVPYYSQPPVCREFTLTNDAAGISGMRLRNTLFDDEGYVVVNNHIVHYWYARERAPLTMDLDFDLAPYINMTPGATNTVLLYTKDVYNVVYGGMVQLEIGSDAQCTVTGSSDNGQPSECCTGMSVDGICAQRPDGAYCEEQTASLCESLTCGERVCGNGGGSVNCGDAICDQLAGESQSTCCIDCGCAEGTTCLPIRGGSISPRQETGNTISNQQPLGTNPGNEGQFTYACVEVQSIGTGGETLNTSETIDAPGFPLEG